MLRLRHLGTVAPLLLGLLATTARADADEAPPPSLPSAQLAPLPQAQVQVAPAPPQQAPAQGQGSTIIIQQYPQQGYQPPGYQQAPPGYAPPGYPPPGYQQGQPYYVPQGAQGQLTPPGPRVIRDWDEGEPIPLGYHKEEHVRTGLVIGGAVTFGSMYLLTALGASIANDAGGSVGALYVPGLGPFIQMAQTSSSTAAFWLAFDGVVQLGGVAMFVAGFALPKKQLVRNDVGFELHLAPIIARDQTGMGVVGRF